MTNSTTNQNTLLITDQDRKQWTAAFDAWDESRNGFAPGGDHEAGARVLAQHRVSQSTGGDQIDPVSSLVEAFWHEGAPYTIEDSDEARVAINTFMRFIANRVDAFQDVKTHRSNWREAIILSRDVASEGSEDVEADRSYWQHELSAFDRTFGSLIAFLEEEESLEPFDDFIARTRTAQPDRKPVAWRWRNPGGVWNYQEGEQRIAGVEQEPLYSRND